MKIITKLILANKILIAILWTVILACIAMLTIALGSKRGDHIMPRVWLRVVTAIFGIRINAHYEAAIDESGTNVFISNHTSVVDGFALILSLKAMPRFIGKRSIGRIPIIGKAWVSLGHKLINRSEGAEAYRILAQTARDNHGEYSFYMAPEGTRFNQQELGEFKPGAFVLAQALDAPIVPVAIVGADSVWPAGTWDIRSGQVDIYFGKPTKVGPMAPDKAAFMFRERIQGMLKHHHASS